MSGMAATRRANHDPHQRFPGLPPLPRNEPLGRDYAIIAAQALAPLALIWTTLWYGWRPLTHDAEHVGTFVTSTFAMLWLAKRCMGWGWTLYVTYADNGPMTDRPAGRAAWTHDARQAASLAIMAAAGLNEALGTHGIGAHLAALAAAAVGAATLHANLTDQRQAFDRFASWYPTRVRKHLDRMRKALDGEPTEYERELLEDEIDGAVALAAKAHETKVAYLLLGARHVLTGDRPDRADVNRRVKQADGMVGYRKRGEWAA